MTREVLTHSHMQLRKNCPVAEHYRYERGLVRRAQSASLTIGSAVHRGIETGKVEEALRMFEGVYPSTQADQDAHEVMMATVEAMLTGYFAAYEPFDSYEAEIPFQVPIINPDTKARSKTFDLAGKVDGLTKIDGQWWICEYKTTSQLTRAYIDRLQLDTQITTYMYGLQRLRSIKVAGVIYRIIKKPTIRQKQTETASQFRERVVEDYRARPEFYFDEQRLYRSQEDLEDFERELWMFTQRILQERREGIHFKNTSRCAEYGGCPYIPLCLKYQDAMDLYTHAEPNSELKGDESSDNQLTG